MEQERVDEEEESSGEKELNLRPMHHRAAGSSDDAAKEESELSARWTLRKQAALTLDNVALSFPPADILSFALPKIQESFQSGDVLVRESGMLALGALSSGCLDDMADYIPQLFPFLIQNMLDSLPEMRSISCWVLSRYCALFEEHNGESLGGGYYEQTLQALLATMFDVKPKVQVAACSALCILIENSFYAPQSSAPDAPEVNLVSLFIPAILQAVNKAFLVYGVKSSLILIDSIGTLADTVGTDLRNPAYTALYLPQLVAKYNELDDFDMRMFPVLECFTSLLSVLGLEAQSYVQHIYQRSLRMLQMVMKPVAGGEDEDFEAPVKDFAICALDVISALSEGLGDLFPTLVAGSRDVLLEGMLLTMNDELAELRQSGFSLSGEVCKNSFSLLTAEVAGHVLELAVRNLDVDFPLVCNNAAWTVGELALQAKGDFMRPYVPRVMQALIVALQQPDGVLEDNLKINIAVTIGRLGIVNTAEVAQLADEFFADWCR
jgi:transportin-1